MGLWEFCFNKFRHPDYQFDHLFHGCHALYGEEYRLIREKLLPGWLMVVQFFVTVAFISSYLGQIVIVGLLLRYPMERILKYEWQFVGLAFVFKSLTGIFADFTTITFDKHLQSCWAQTQTFFCIFDSAVLLFLAICIFGGLCWDRDWLLYPNYNYVSWSYALATFSTLGHIIAASFLFFVSTIARPLRKKLRKNHRMYSYLFRNANKQKLEKKGIKHWPCRCFLNKDLDPTCTTCKVPDLFENKGTRSTMIRISHHMTRYRDCYDWSFSLHHENTDMFKNMT